MNRSNHALRRARERYGVKLQGKELDEISAKIAKGDAHRLNRTGDTIVYAVFHGDHLLVAAYKRKEKRVLTFLFPAKYIGEIIRLGLTSRVTVALKCKRCNSDVTYDVDAQLVGATTATGQKLSPGKKLGDCHLCGGRLVTQRIKHRLGKRPS
jgi:hypothetical protein